MELREGYATVHENELRAVPKELRHEIGLSDGACTLCYARTPGKFCNPCLVGHEYVIVPAHIATIIKINQPSND